MLKKLYKHHFIIIISVCVVAYWGLWNGFFQQDEWAGLGYFYSYYNLSLIDKLKTIYAPMFTQSGGHFLFLTPLVNFIRYSLFETHFEGYAYLSISIHTILCLLIYKLSLKIGSSKAQALLSAIIFAVMATASQAVEWVGTSVPTQLAAVFSVVSALFFLDWLKKKNRKNVLLCIVTLFIAVSFKETAFFLIPLFGSVLLFSKVKQKRVLILGLIGAAGIYMLFQRILFAKLSIILILKNLLIITTKGVPELLVPNAIFVSISKNLVYFLGIHSPPLNTTEYDIFLQNDILSPLIKVLGVLALLLIGVLSFVVYRKKKDINALFPVLWLLFSFWPLAFITQAEIHALFLPGRNLYIPLIAVSILIAYLCIAIAQLKRGWIVFIFLAMFVYMHVSYLRNEIGALNDQGQIRLTILNKFVAKAPNLPDHVLIYTESDSSYYGLTEKIMPFQSGFGQTLLVWYYSREHWPSSLLNNSYLWDITAEDYKESAERGFGYAYDKQTLKELVKENNLKPDQIIGFKWYGKNQSLKQIPTESMRQLYE